VVGWGSPTIGDRWWWLVRKEPGAERLATLSNVRGAESLACFISPRWWHQMCLRRWSFQPCLQYVLARTLRLWVLFQWRSCDISLRSFPLFSFHKSSGKHILMRTYALVRSRLTPRCTCEPHICARIRIRLYLVSSNNRRVRSTTTRSAIRHVNVDADIPCGNSPVTREVRVQVEQFDPELDFVCPL
jgi:hypothetical protein